MELSKDSLSRLLEGFANQTHLRLTSRRPSLQASDTTLHDMLLIYFGREPPLQNVLGVAQTTIAMDPLMVSTPEMRRDWTV